MNWLFNKLSTIEGALSAMALLCGLIAGAWKLCPKILRSFRKGAQSVSAYVNVGDTLAEMKRDAKAAHESLRKDMEAGFKRLEEGQLHQIGVRHAMANAHDDIIFFSADEHGKFRWVSKAWFRYTGQECHSARGNGWELALPEDDRARVLYAWQMAIDHERNFEQPITLRNHFGGELTTFTVTAEPIRLKSDGHIIDYFGVMKRIGTTHPVTLAAPEPMPHR